MDALILVGGLGSRLGDLTKNTPKPMLLIRNKPFLLHKLEHLYKNGFKNVILASGYKHKVLSNFFSSLNKGYEIPNIIYSIEKEPLGTGGAILNSLDKIISDNIFVFNGDSFIDINYEDFYEFHLKKKSQISICTNYMKNSSRYGNVIFDECSRLKELSNYNSDNVFINSGSYIIKTSFLNELNKAVTKRCFSFEETILSEMRKKIKIFCYESTSFFIDIGIPEDYKLAQKILFNE